jgi:hypothetical protein
MPGFGDVLRTLQIRQCGIDIGGYREELTDSRRPDVRFFGRKTLLAERFTQCSRDIDPRPRQGHYLVLLALTKNSALFGFLFCFWRERRSALWY